MALFPLSKKKADAIGNGVFLMMLGILLYTNDWWPWILIALAISFGLRQLLTNRIKDMIISLSLFGILFVISFFKLTFTSILPWLFVIVGAYVVLREYFYEDEQGS